MENGPAALVGRTAELCSGLFLQRDICKGEAPEPLCPQLLLRTEVPARFNSEILFLRGDILCAYSRDVCDLCDGGDGAGCRVHALFPHMPL